MMDIVMKFPPADRYSSEKIANEDADQCICPIVMRNSQMASIMRRECQLMPKGTEKDCGKIIVPRGCRADEEVRRKKGQE